MIFFSFFKNLFIYLFIYFWLCLDLRCHAWASHCGGLSLQSTGSRCMGFTSCSTRAQYLWHTGLVALRHVGSSQTRA